MGFNSASENPPVELFQGYFPCEQYSSGVCSARIYIPRRVAEELARRGIDSESYVAERTVLKARSVVLGER